MKGYDIKKNAPNATIAADDEKLRSCHRNVKQVKS
jgi:hypothetical protein